MEVEIVSEVSSELVSPKKRRRISGSSAVILAAVTILIVLVSIVMFNLWREGVSRNQLAQKAEAVLGARLSDSRDGAEVIHMETYYKGDVMWFDFIMSDEPQERCSAVVKISEDEQRFGISPIQEVPFNKQESSTGFCATVSDEPDGLSIEY